MNGHIEEEECIPMAALCKSERKASQPTMLWIVKKINPLFGVKKVALTLNLI